MLDPLSVLVGVPVLGPVVVWLFRQHDRMQRSYEELARAHSDQVLKVVSDNTAAARALEKAIDRLVDQHDRVGDHHAAMSKMRMDP